MDAELTAFVTTAVTALTGLMVSESWEQAKLRISRLLRRRGTDQDPQGELQAASDELTRARADGDERAAERVGERLRDRLLDTLRDDPETARELARLITELAPDTPVTYVSSVSGGVYHGPTLQGAHITGNITFEVPAPPPPGVRVRPNQVPALTYEFVNRHSDLDRLRDVFTAGRAGSGTVDLGVVAGVSGVGKSATAHRFAGLVQELYPDGQLYVDFAALRDQSGSAPAAVSDVSEALATCLVSLGVGKDAMPQTVEARRNLFRSCTTELRILLVLDDVTEPAHVRALIPKGPGSGVLVTTHAKLGELAVRDGAKLIALKPLDAHGGLALLGDFCPPGTVAADRAGAERLVELCGGLPVALRIVAARLVTEDGLTVAELVEELSDETDRLAGLSLPAEELSVSAALGPSYRLLPPDAARLHRLLGWLPTGLFDAGVAAVAADIDVREAKRLLGVLASASLVERRADKRYAMHDLIRLHARERAVEEEPATEETALVGRVATHYLVLAALADRAIKKNRLRIADLSALLAEATDPFAAVGGPSPLAWLDTERAAILGVLRAASRHGWNSLVWPLAEAFTALFLNRRYLDAWRESLELGVAAAVAVARSATTAGEITEATAAEARLRSLLSRPLLDLGRRGEARIALESAVTAAETAGDVQLIASVLEFQGRYLDKYDPKRAVGVYERSLVLNEQAGQTRGAAIVAFFLGCALDARGDDIGALTALYRAHGALLADAEPDVRMAARALAAIGAVHDRLGDTAAADRELREAVAVLRERDALHYAADPLVRRADIARRTGAGTDVVRGFLTDALAIYDGEGNPAAEELRRRIAELDADD
ncbi:NB-ARC domain-containing protein [Streptomyces prunicolor]|uniref:NB-ARC domain-containing protein n=1 Tax=Streptomyces prunicolor TaxID=67348 RepID=UPI00371B1BF3